MLEVGVHRDHRQAPFHGHKNGITADNPQAERIQRYPLLDLGIGPPNQDPDGHPFGLPKAQSVCGVIPPVFRVGDPVVDGASGTAGGAPNYNSRGPTTPARAFGKTRAASVPQVMFNSYVTYQLDNGFGASFGPQVTGEQWQNQEGSLRIPMQYVINAFVFYRQPKWDVQINFFNITDQRNWTSIDPSFAGNEVIYPEQPFRISGQIRFRF